MLLKVDFKLVRFQSAAILLKDDSTNDGPIVSVVSFGFLKISYEV